jgi:excisionase family DNA binding protein
MPQDTKTRLEPTALAVSPSDGAVIAGVGRTKFYEAISSGEIASFKIGARRLIRVATIEAYLRRLEDEAAR